MGFIEKNGSEKYVSENMDRKKYASEKICIGKNM